jgi:hypothetical protein
MHILILYALFSSIVVRSLVVYIYITTVYKCTSTTRVYSGTNFVVVLESLLRCGAVAVLF